MAVVGRHKAAIPRLGGAAEVFWTSLLWRSLLQRLA
eukprot:CAMPEP_0179010310 /NCGR_PEP_ID=MMETSP0796-20121207/36_1 /TAXON_ID=73915 /ORGANISM="Pyrodinium bahamense, Strain pbaha01" /LENGTH=35 /DNA_ID= /DNA_START= /DNA_END= /DNA_ORIENTATION=